MCGAFVCSGNFRHGDRKNRWCDIVTSFYWILVWMVRSALKAHAASAEAEDPSGEYKIYPAWKCALYIVGGAVAIKFGGDFVVDGASAIAVKSRVKPESDWTYDRCNGNQPAGICHLCGSCKKNEVDMAFGNVIGSNIFNILFILGVTAAISPVAFIMENVVDSILLVLVSILVWVFAWSRLHIEKKRRCGAACIICSISGVYLYEIGGRYCSLASLTLAVKLCAKDYIMPDYSPMHRRCI